MCIKITFEKFIDDMKCRKKDIKLSYDSKDYIVEYKNIEIKDTHERTTDKLFKKIAFKEIDNYFTLVEMLSCSIPSNAKLTVSIEEYNVEDISFENQEYIITTKSDKKYIIKIIE